MNKDDIYEQCKNFNKFLANTKVLVEKITITSGTRKNDLLISFLAIIESHATSIHILINQGHPNSAYALVRPLIEATLRMRYMYHIMDTKKIGKLYTTKDWNKLFPSLKKMASEIDSYLKVSTFTASHNSVKSVIHDYAHTGLYQVASTYASSGSYSGRCTDTLKQHEVLIASQAYLFTTYTLYLEKMGLADGTITTDELNHYISHTEHED